MECILNKFFVGQTFAIDIEKEEFEPIAERKQEKRTD